MLSNDLLHTYSFIETVFKEYSCHDRNPHAESADPALSQKLIEALKIRAGHENTSVNALAARFLDDGLKTAAAGDGYFQLVADPEATVR